MPTGYCARFRRAANRAGQGSINTNTTPAGVAALVAAILPLRQGCKESILSRMRSSPDS